MASFSSIKIKNTFREAFKQYPWDYMLLILAAFIIPAIYGLLNRYFIGYMSYTSIVVDQSYEAVEVSLEVLLEMFPLAVLALVAWRFTDKQKITSIVKTALIMQLIITICFVSFLFIYGDVFIDWINTPESARSLAGQYFRIIALSMPFQAMSTVLLVAIKSMRKGWLAVGLAFVGVGINFALDAVFISNYSFSLHLGLIGSAWDRVAANVALFIITGLVFWWMVRKEVKLDLKIEKKVAKAIFKIGRWTGLESLVRNAGYIIGVIAVVNFIGSRESAAIGGYNTAMWVMWVIALIPVLSWTEATNVAVGNAYGRKDYQSMWNIQKVSILIVTIYMLIWAVIGSFVWGPISGWLNASASHEVVDYSVLTFQLLIFPYILFAIGSCLKSFFIGTGRPFWIFFTSALVNVGIYIPLGLMVKLHVISISYYDFLIITNIVFILDFVIIVYLLWRYGYRRLKHQMGEEVRTNG
jgi:Na+-driven multidrug efflux pump